MAFFNFATVVRQWGAGNETRLVTSYQGWRCEGWGICLHCLAQSWLLRSDTLSSYSSLHIILLTLRGLQETDHHNWYFHDRSSVVPRPEVWLPLRVLCCSGRRQYSTNYGPDRLTCLPSLRRVPGELSLYNQQLDYNLLSPSLLLILLLLLDIVIFSRNLITIRTFLFSEMSNIFKPNIVDVLYIGIVNYVSFPSPLILARSSQKLVLSILSLLILCCSAVPPTKTWLGGNIKLRTSQNFVRLCWKSELFLLFVGFVMWFLTDKIYIYCRKQMFSITTKKPSICSEFLLKIESSWLPCH